MTVSLSKVHLIAMILHNISQLIGVVDPAKNVLAGAEMESEMGILYDAWIAFENGKITDFGTGNPPAGELIDAHGGIVFSTFCDSHTHIIYAGSRHGEFLDKINGLSYEEIAARGGGILNSADLLGITSEEELYTQALARAKMMMSMGTGAIEIKSGYGLTVESELKMLRVARRIAQDIPARIRATFLGAHAVGRAYAGRQTEYVDMLINDMLPAVAAEGLADFVDVFCDRGFFTTEETARILDAAAKYGIRPKIHANELAISGGVQVGVAHNAVSVDHLERMGAEEIDVLRNSSTIPTMLPGASFFLSMPYAPARDAINAGLPVALASDYNPGSSPSGDMRFVMALACIKMRLKPIEALAATTINGAAAMDLRQHCGAIARGADASFIVTKPIPGLEYIPYAYTEPFISSVYIRGQKV